ncbi:hypothetical protein CDAR_187581 [Caerostris darwini]|uniref:Uncharacterized protein n=1 Tax=Caerostris darwini TaxID=1538125 RepID=A0AAV4SZK9_9ARAC|nr:hypothetical protein CDAR_187581 [Caerostris darwini]
MDCRARLVVPPQFAVMVSLRQVGFRINVQGSCRDYIQIQKETLCENIYRVDEERHFDSLSGPNIGQMDILYHTSKEGLDNKTLSDIPDLHSLSLLSQKSESERLAPSRAQWQPHLDWAPVRRTQQLRGPQRREHNGMREWWGVCTAHPGHTHRVRARRHVRRHTGLL